MRKVLLASTALIALGSVSAMAADISISGSSEMVLDMGDSATADDSGFAVEHDIAITFSDTTDSGITMSMVYGIDDDGTPDDSETTISGDFGEVRYTRPRMSTLSTTLTLKLAQPLRKCSQEQLQLVWTIGSLGNHMTYVLPSLVDVCTLLLQQETMLAVNVIICRKI